MATDFDSSLPVRTENPGDVKVNVVDSVTPSQGLAVDATGKVGVKLSDGAGTALTSTLDGAKQALDVHISGGTVAVGIEDRTSFVYGTDIETTVGAVYNDTGATVTTGQQAALRMTANRALHTNLRDAAGAELVGQKAMAASVPVVLASDQSDVPVEVTQPLPAGTNLIGKATISEGGNDAAVTAGGELQVLATAQPGVDIGDVTVNNGAGAAAVNIQDGGNSITVDGAVTANAGTGTFDTNLAEIAGAAPSAANPLPSQLSDGAAFYDARDTRALTAADVVSANIRDAAGAAFGPTNPLPVYIQDSIGTEVNDFKDADAIAAGASDNHDYTVTAAKILNISQIIAAASGKARFEVKVETGVATGVFNTVMVQFNSTANPNCVIPVNEQIRVAAGVRVRITGTNEDKNPQSLYSTICGHEI